MPPNRLTATEAAAKLQAELDAILLDVRPPSWYAQGHAAGAYNLPIFDVDAAGEKIENPQFVEQAAELFGKERPIITICNAGPRSQQATGLLLEAGFSDVADIAGGLKGKTDESGTKLVPGWIDAGLPVETEAQPGRDANSLMRKLKTG